MSNMSPGETTLFQRYLLKAKRYLEYGMGESTRLAATRADLRTASVESSPGFISRGLLSHTSVIRALSKGRLVVHLINIGETKEWGYPVDESRREYWPQYCESPWVGSPKYDLILVDGRFRVACALQALLNKATCPVIIHDFWNRPHYHGVLDFYDVTERVETTAVLRAKESVDLNAVRTRYDTAKYITK